MKKTTLLFFAFFCFSLSAQQLIDNKGNRNQSYPIITETKPEVVNLINQVSQDSIEAHIRYMQGFIRKATSPEALIVQNWLVDNFESYGYEDISIHKFYINSQLLDAGNVVVVKKGTEFPDEYIMITSHYDHSTYDTPSGPGADDNASGTSGVLECSRLLKNFPTKRSIMFVPFNAEEYWLQGSLPFAEKCASEHMNIIAHFNMDMIGWFPPDSTNTIMASGYSYISQALFEYYQQTANTYMPSIPTIRFSDSYSYGDVYGGDHMPFNIYEYPSLFISDMQYQKQNPCYHKPCDTIGVHGSDNCGVNRLDLVQAFIQAVLAATAELANAWLPPQNLSACSGIDKITISWDKDNESTSYKLFKNNELLDEI
ncbi:MAG: M28 family peptidase, partial [Bacteroidales bacterium]|nr:M28 family peptidase [Bacteroidales bacterium]